MSDKRATMTDWVWVEACVLQSMVGILPTNVIHAVVLREEHDEWVLKLFTTAPLSDDLEDDLRLMPAEAEDDLSQVHREPHPTEKIVTTPAVVRPIRVEIVVGEYVPIGYMNLHPDRERFLFFQRPPDEE